jgi:purine-binding chemotaxis protein CheW
MPAVCKGSVKRERLVWRRRNHLANIKYMATETLSPVKGQQQKLAGKYLTFTLHGESYGIDVLKVREIIRLITITAVPQMPDYVKGVINLRGKIIPVIDLRVRFGFTGVKDTELTCIIVVQVKLPDGKNIQMGLIVDGVEEVVNLAPGDIEETPDFGGKISTEYIIGMAKVKGAVKTLLNIDRVLCADELQQIQVAA